MDAKSVMGIIAVLMIVIGFVFSGLSFPANLTFTTQVPTEEEEFFPTSLTVSLTGQTKAIVNPNSHTYLKFKKGELLKKPKRAFLVEMIYEPGITTTHYVSEYAEIIVTTIAGKQTTFTRKIVFPATVYLYDPEKNPLIKGRIEPINGKVDFLVLSEQDYARFLRGSSFHVIYAELDIESARSVEFKPTENYRNEVYFVFWNRGDMPVEVNYDFTIFWDVLQRNVQTRTITTQTVSQICVGPFPMLGIPIFIIGLILLIMALATRQTRQRQSASSNFSLESGYRYRYRDQANC